MIPNCAVHGKPLTDNFGVPMCMLCWAEAMANKRKRDEMFVKEGNILLERMRDHTDNAAAL